MVCDKDADCPIDMDKEGLDVTHDGEWVFAKGTTLGGDNGIAVAYAMAMLAETSDGNSRQQILDLFGLDTIEQLREQVNQVKVLQLLLTKFVTSQVNLQKRQKAQQFLLKVLLKLLKMVQRLQTKLLTHS